MVGGRVEFLAIEKKATLVVDGDELPGLWRSRAGSRAADVIAGTAGRFEGAGEVTGEEGGIFFRPLIGDAGEGDAHGRVNRLAGVFAHKNSRAHHHGNGAEHEPEHEKIDGSAHVSGRELARLSLA